MIWPSPSWWNGQSNCHIYDWQIYRSSKMYFWYSYVVHRNIVTRHNFSWIYFYRRSTCFRRFLRPSSGAHNCAYSFRYCQQILLLAAAVRKMEHLIHGSSYQQYWLTIPKAVCTVMCSWWWAEKPPETCKASVEICKASVEINSRKVASCWL